MAKQPCVAIVFLLVGLSAGCDGNGVGNDVGVADMPMMDLDVAGEGTEATEEPLLQFTNATCKKIAECGPTFLQMAMGDMAGCKVLEYEGVKPMADLHGMDADWAACAAWTLAETCAVFIRAHIGQVLTPAACKWTSTLQDGAACTHPYQCANLVCARALGSSCGVCASPLALGADCEGDYLIGSPCGIGSTCAAGKCVAVGDIDAPCDPTSAPCYADLGCLDGKCAPPRQANEPCTSLTGECDYYGKGLICHPVLGACLALTVAGPGEACGLSDTAAAVCRVGTCYPSPLAGTCMAQVEDGASCDATVGPDCQIHEHCVNGRCEKHFKPDCE